jgi:acetyl-CoA carboxylase biotin carboxyl carrier protein
MAEKIEAEIVAKVLKIVATEGQPLAEGDTVVILESMKMEIPVVTESTGTLTHIAVREGDTVQEHDLIALVE